MIGLYTPLVGYYPLAPWAGFAVLCGYTALALGLAVFLLRRRRALGTAKKKREAYEEAVRKPVEETRRREKMDKEEKEQVLKRRKDVREHSLMQRHPFLS